VEIEHAGVVEKHLSTAGDHLFDHFIDGVIQRQGALAAIGEQTISIRGEVRGILEVGLNE
jgi:hypothetical protein